MNITTTTWPEGVVTRYLTVGGATADVHTHRYLTREHPARGKPYVVDKSYEVDGFNWRCLGCGRKGCTDSWGERGYRDLNDAQDAAQAHAEKCRAMPKPQTIPESATEAVQPETKTGLFGLFGRRPK